MLHCQHELPLHIVYDEEAYVAKITWIKKRDGRVETYRAEKIAAAVRGAFGDAGEVPQEGTLEQVVELVEAALAEAAPASAPAESRAVSVEDIQDEVERALMRLGSFETAKRYILYRHRRTELREVRSELAGAVAEDPQGVAA